MLGSLKIFSKKIDPLYKLYLKVMNPENGITALNVLKSFSPFKPNSAGSYRVRSALTISTINNVFPSLENLLPFSSGIAIPTLNVDQFMDDPENLRSSLRLADSFNYYGSDKSTRHDYHKIYGPILNDFSSIKKILEVGLGTNNSDIVSTMGSSGKPGASLRAFRDFCPYADIYGADIDSRILFQEERIETYYVDQLSITSLRELASNTGTDFDLVIDDGLHSPDANINTLVLGLSIVKVNGWVVIEDIGQTAGHQALWVVTSTLLDQKRFKATLLKCKGAFVLAVQRIS